MKKKIAVIYGGYSSEWEISVKSGKYVASVLDRNIFDVHEVFISSKKWLVDNKFEIDKADFSFTDEKEKYSFDAAVIVIHGTPGENGYLQSYFELIGLPYVSCNVLGSSLTFNKFYCNYYLKSFGINVASSVLIGKHDKINPQDIVSKLGLPVFVKPNAGGSSFGTTKVKKTAELEPAIKLSRQESSEVIIESYIQGREITVGVIKQNGKTQTLTPCEIVSKNEFFDYEAKYNSKLNEEIIPAPISKNQIEKVQKLAAKIYDLLNCRGIVRIDFIFSEHDQQFYFLELNSIPGMTSESIVPKMLRYDNIDITKLYSELIISTLEEK